MKGSESQGIRKLLAKERKSSYNFIPTKHGKPQETFEMIHTAKYHKKLRCHLIDIEEEKRRIHYVLDEYQSYKCKTPLCINTIN